MLSEEIKIDYPVSTVECEIQKDPNSHRRPLIEIQFSLEDLKILHDEYPKLLVRKFETFKENYEKLNKQKSDSDGVKNNLFWDLENLYDENPISDLARLLDKYGPHILGNNYRKKDK